MAWYERPPKSHRAEIRRNTEANNKVDEQAKMQTPLEGCLSHYIRLEKPGYAILVTGEWGSGKTHQVTRLIPESQSYYVSLFGVKSVEEARRAVFAKMSPIKNIARSMAHSVDQAGIELPTGGSVSLGSIPSSLIGAFVKDNVKTDRVLILDDLERTGLNSAELLSLLNDYVEHHGMNVIALCNDRKLGKNLEEFKATNEKVFGRIIAVEPEVDEAFSSFINGPEFEALKPVFLANQIAIFEIFGSSKVNSLRILKFALQDACRCLSALESRHFENEAHTELLIRHLIALSIEVRAGNLAEEDIKQRDNTFARAVKRHLNKGEPVEIHPFDAIQDKHSILDLKQSVLSTEILTNLLIKGYCEPQSIVDWIDQSPYYLPESETRHWKIVWDKQRYTTETVAAALEQMSNEVRAGCITEMGELLHIFCLELDLISIDQVDNKAEHLLAEYQVIVNNLHLAGKLTELSPAQQGQSTDREYAHGFGFYRLDSSAPYFNDFFDYFKEMRIAVFEARYPEFQQEILEALSKDARAFSALVAYDFSRGGKFQSIPVLGKISKEDFVEAWLKCPKDWDWLRVAIERRYEAGRMKTEWPWWNEVSVLLNAKIAELSPLRRYQMMRNVPALMPEPV